MFATDSVWKAGCVHDNTVRLVAAMHADLRTKCSASSARNCAPMYGMVSDRPHPYHMLGRCCDTRRRCKQIPHAHRPGRFAEPGRPTSGMPCEYAARLARAECTLEGGGGGEEPPAYRVGPPAGLLEQPLSHRRPHIASASEGALLHSPRQRGGSTMGVVRVAISCRPGFRRPGGCKLALYVA